MGTYGESGNLVGSGAAALDLCGEAATAVKLALAEIQKPFCAPFPWPEPRPAPEPEMDFEGGERETLPKLASGDPRYEVAVITMQRREAEFEALKVACAPWNFVRDTFAQCHAIVTKHADRIPGKIARRIGTTPVGRDAINDRAKVQARGRPHLLLLGGDGAKVRDVSIGKGSESVTPALPRAIFDRFQFQLSHWCRGRDSNPDPLI